MLEKFKNYIINHFIASIFFKPFLKIFRIIAKKGVGSDLCLREGFLPVPVHFYSPIPDVEDLKNRKIWDSPSKLRGINFNTENQIRLLKEIGRKYSDECQWSFASRDSLTEFYINNSSFSYGCAASTHSMIRKFKPKRFIEIGSGLSSRVIFNALERNYAEDKDSQADYIVIDPYPTEFLKTKPAKSIKVLNRRVEIVGEEIFKKLSRNDILFIDSGHSVRIGGDVNFLILDILPQLAPGVIVHFHDIELPYEYSRQYATQETFRQFWTEQYMLQGFLCFNNEYDILLAMNYIMSDHNPAFRRSFTHYNPDIHQNKSGSFWIKRKTQHTGN